MSVIKETVGLIKDEVICESVIKRTIEVIKGVISSISRIRKLINDEWGSGI